MRESDGMSDLSHVVVMIHEMVEDQEEKTLTPAMRILFVPHRDLEAKAAELFHAAFNQRPLAHHLTEHERDCLEHQSRE